MCSILEELGVILRLFTQPFLKRLCKAAHLLDSCNDSCSDFQYLVHYFFLEEEFVTFIAYVLHFVVDQLASFSVKLVDYFD